MDGVLKAQPGVREVLLAAVLLLVPCVALAPIENADVPALAVLFGVAWTLCLALLINGKPEGIYRPGVTYLVLFGLFHGGLLVSIALRGDSTFVADTEEAWVYDGHVGLAVRLAVLGMLAFALVAELTGGRHSADRQITRPEPELRRVLGTVGLFLEFVGLVLFGMAVWRAGGIDVLTGSYTSYVDANQAQASLGYGYLFLGIGPALAVVAGGRARTVAWVAFGCYAVVALLIGNRGEVLFPLVALLAVEARRGRRPSSLWTVAGMVGVLVLVGVIRQARLTGLSALSSVSSPLDGMAEMGFSLRPVTVVLDWHAAAEPFRNGETLIAVPLRFVENLLGSGAYSGAYDDRLFNVEIMERAGPIGGSPIAEAYHNFGAPGVVLFMAAVGLLIGLIERSPRSALADARVAIVLLPLLMQIRNSFAPVPVQLAVGFVLLWGVMALAGRGSTVAVPSREGVR